LALVGGCYNATGCDLIVNPVAVGDAYFLNTSVASAWGRRMDTLLDSLSVGLAVVIVLGIVEATKVVTAKIGLSSWGWRRVWWTTRLNNQIARWRVALGKTFPYL